MFEIKEILCWTQGRLSSGDKNTSFRSISTDSRNINKGELFIAIKGEKFDGHDFIIQALQKGMAGSLVAESWFKAHSQILTGITQPVVVVDDTVAALGKIACGYRKKFGIPVIAVTGSNGKTTTKEMIAMLLNSSYPVLKSQGSFNNHIGVPLTLLKLNSEHRAAVLELGMNRRGEIRYLTDIASPTVAVITNVAEAHLEFFDNLSAIAEAKCELLENLGKDNSAVINVDCETLYSKAESFPARLIGFGIEKDCNYRATDVTANSDGVEFVLNQKDRFRINMLGRHNVYNALAAIAVADCMGMDRKLVREKLADFSSPATWRMQTFDLDGIQIIADCYNANPGSMEAAIRTLSEIKNKKRKILVFADMLELGKFSEDCHHRIGELIAKCAIDILITVGEKAAYAAEAAISSRMRKEEVFICSNNAEVCGVLLRLLQPEDVVLLKGSRRMRLEEIVEKL